MPQMPVNVLKPSSTLMQYLPSLPNPIEMLSTKESLIEESDNSTSSQLLPSFVTNSVTRIVDVFEKISNPVPSVVDVVFRIFGVYDLEVVRSHSKPFKPMLQIMVMLLKALRFYVQNTDPEEICNVISRIIEALLQVIPED